MHNDLLTEYNAEKWLHSFLELSFSSDSFINWLVSAKVAASDEIRWFSSCSHLAGCELV